MKAMMEKIYGSLVNFQSLIFDRTLENKNRVGVWIWLIGLYLLGLIYWGTLFDWRRSPLSYHDWYGIFLPRLEVMRDAIHYQMLPLHVDCKCLHGITDRFLTSPDVITTPQMLLLSVMDVDTFAVVDLFLHYTMASIGLMLLRRRLQLSLIPFSFLFVLFNLNGHIQAHYVMGHLNWGGYFIFPYFILMILQAFDQQPSWKWVAGWSFLSLYLVLAGSQHHFTWWMLFLLFLALTYKPLFKWNMAAILFSGFLSAVRLLPPALQLHEFSAEQYGFRTGYFTLQELVYSFMTLRPFDFIVPELYKYKKLGYWEFNYYVGFIGLAFMLYFGLLYWLKGHERLKKYLPLFVPSLLIFVLSIGHIYEYTLYNFPVLASERVTSRMISVPATLLMVVAAIGFQGFIEVNRSSLVRWLVMSSFVILMSDIHTHVVLWNVGRIGKTMGIVKLQFPGNSIINHPDPQYMLTLWIGVGVTLMTALTLFVLVWRERNKSPLV